MESKIKKTKKSKQKSLAKKLGKTGTAIVAVLTFIGASFGAWQAYKYVNTKNAAGAWKIKLTTTKSSYKPYIGETMGIKIFLKQDGENITGTGEKWDYNGAILPYDQHRKLELEGTVDGKELKINYILHGAKRESRGIFNLIVTEGEKKLEGTFLGTAGDASGIVEGGRE
ncbi:MAG: hypothetical protein IAF38_22245 [Bacteroidia bacterium]|nr:hypothetical protein [Bacteroidia bacterium]